VARRLNKNLASIMLDIIQIFLNANGAAKQFAWRYAKADCKILDIRHGLGW
jgi:hypothetical protein